MEENYDKKRQNNSFIFNYYFSIYSEGGQTKIEKKYCKNSTLSGFCLGFFGRTLNKMEE